MSQKTSKRQATKQSEVEFEVSSPTRKTGVWATRRISARREMLPSLERMSRRSRKISLAKWILKR